MTILKTISEWLDTLDYKLTQHERLDGKMQELFGNCSRWITETNERVNDLRALYVDHTSEVHKKLEKKIDDDIERVRSRYAERDLVPMSRRMDKIEGSIEAIKQHMRDVIRQREMWEKDCGRNIEQLKKAVSEDARKISLRIGSNSGCINEHTKRLDKLEGLPSINGIKANFRCPKCGVYYTDYKVTEGKCRHCDWVGVSVG